MSGASAERFDDAVVAGVRGHMNGDHGQDNLDIVRAFGAPEATSATMVDLDREVGVWRAAGEGSLGEVEIRLPWPGAPLAERSDLRVAIVALHSQAVALLGKDAAEH